jgi:hypothetical protein
VHFFGALGLFVALVLVVLGGVPMIPRPAGRGRRALFDMRAFLVLYTRAGSPFIASGGNFFRVTVYDEFLLVTFLLHQKIAYKDIDAVEWIPKCLPEVRLTVGKVRVRIFGRRPKIEMLYQELKRRSGCSP